MVSGESRNLEFFALGRLDGRGQCCMFSSMKKNKQNINNKKKILASSTSVGRVNWLGDKFLIGIKVILQVQMYFWTM